MTPEKEKALAEFAAEFLGLQQDKTKYWHHELILYKWDLANYVFTSRVHSPQLMHLAKREMERGRFKIKFANNVNCDYLNAKYVYSITDDMHDDHPKQHLSNNEFHAFWSALEQAVGGGE